jgi:hypothetical protein
LIITYTQSHIRNSLYILEPKSLVRIGEKASRGERGKLRKPDRAGRRILTYIDSFVGETRRDGGAFFFGFAKEDGELLDGGHGNVSTVVAG